MKTKKVSIATAAEAVGVSRKTLQRALADGRLAWVGPRRGRYAQGLDMDQVLRLCGNPGKPAHLVAVHAIERAGGDWRNVFGALFNQIATGAGQDLDVIAAALRLLREPSAQHHLRDFCAAFDGGKAYGADDPDRFGLRLACAVRGAVADFNPVPRHISAAQAWRGMLALLCGADAPRSQARPSLSLDLTQATVLVTFRPRWDAGRGRAPDWASIPAESGNARLRLLAPDARHRMRRALRALSDAVGAAPSRYRFASRTWPRVVRYLKAGGRADADERLHALVGVAPQDAQALRYALSLMTSKIQTADATDAVENMARPDIDYAGKGLTVATVARVMGVSRMSVYRNMPAQQRRLKVSNLDTCSECGAVLDPASDTCPECGAFIIA
jgi:hypothetical protein